MHLRGGMDARGIPLQVLHIAELMASRLDGASSRDRR
jgi:hypothetical protein